MTVGQICLHLVDILKGFRLYPKDFIHLFKDSLFHEALTTEFASLSWERSSLILTGILLCNDDKGPVVGLESTLFLITA